MFLTSALLITASQGFGHGLSLLQTRSVLRVADVGPGPSGGGPQGVPPVRLDFGKAKVVYNNLGGLGPGPKSSPPVILFTNAGHLTKGNAAVDLVIANTSKYLAKDTSNNGITEEFLYMNLAANTHVDLNFTLFYAGTKKRVELADFYFTVWDIDQSADAGARESVTVGPIDEHLVSINTEIITTDNGDDSFTFESTQTGTSADNPSSTFAVSTLQSNRAVTSKISQKGTWAVTMKNVQGKSGRNFVFSGESSLVPNPCVNHRNLNFSLGIEQNNIDGQGPAKGQPVLRYQRVTKANGTMVDLLVTAGTLYKPWKIERNGLNGKVAEVNQAGNMKTNYTFSFVVTDTNKPVPVGRFFFTIFDLDGTKHGYEKLTVSNRGFSDWAVTNTSTIAVHNGTKYVTFDSTVKGTLEDNPTNYKSLTKSQKDKAVTFWYENPVSEFAMSFAIENITEGRNFLFGGLAGGIFCE